MAELKKDENNGMILGVCSGLANYFEMDSSVIRILFVLATIFGVGTPILIYIILALVMRR